MKRPGSTEFGMPVCAVAIVPLPIVMWPGDADLAGERDAVLDRRAAGDADLRGEQHVAADRSRRARSAPGCRSCVPAPIRVSPTAGRSIVVFAPISTSSSIDHAADLRDLVVRAVGRPREPEPVAADDGAVLDDDAVADPHALANRDARVDHAVVADLRLAADGHVRMHDRPRPDPRAVADDGKRADRRVRRRSWRWPRHRQGGERPAAGATRPRRARRPCANARYGWRARSIAHGAPSALIAGNDGRRSPSRFSAAAYLGLAKKVRSPAPASSIPATRWISMSPSPSRRQPRRSAMSRSFKNGILQEFRSDRTERELRSSRVQEFFCIFSSSPDLLFEAS